ncbi:hypothetical protein JW796_00635 [Candidatus Dojkabacteria bacterium]|nr:hypothetical protein [Candidatus Dojkabacteria bacterium]
MKKIRKILLVTITVLLLSTSSSVLFPAKTKADGLMDAVFLGGAESIFGCREGEKTAGEAYVKSCGSGSVQGASDSESIMRDHGALGVTANMIDMLYENPPASGIVYAQQTWDKFRTNVTGEVYAQEVYSPGVGFSLLQPVQPYWAWARNISYGFFILIFIAIALQILFRSKIDGQNPATLANSIPGVIISLALVTLSYAITGLTIDLVTIGSNFIKGIYETSGLMEDGSRLPNPDDPRMSVWFVFSTALEGKSAGGELSNIAKGISTEGIALESAANLANGILENTAGSSLISLILGVTILFAAMKLFFELVRRYIQIILNVVLAPILFLLGAMPGGLQKAIFPFMRGFLANATVFIAIYAIFGFMVVLLKDQTHFTTGNYGYVPPLIGFQRDGDMGGIPFNSIKTLVAFSLFITTTLIPDMIDKALDAPDFTQIVNNLRASTAQGAQQTSALLKGVLGTLGNIQGLTGGQGQR